MLPKQSAGCDLIFKQKKKICFQLANLVKFKEETVCLMKYIKEVCDVLSKKAEDQRRNFIWVSCI